MQIFWCSVEGRGNQAEAEMLTLLESPNEKMRAQRTLEKNLTSALRHEGSRNIGHPGGNFDGEVYAQGAGKLWASLGHVFDNKIKRYWNGFGVFEPNAGRQEITVEINVPVKTDTGQVAGFFTRNIDTAEIFLMHSGRVGGGRPGVGKSAFLAHSRATRVEVSLGAGRYRQAVLIGKIDAADLASRIWRYVKQVDQFKYEASSGKLDTPAFKRQVAEFNRYNKEFSGRKSGTRSGSFEYFTYHGDVVDALYTERTARRHAGEEVFNSPLIDLFVKKGRKLTELYEVKTGIERQTLYSAIGQLVTHSSGADGAPTKFLVVPNGTELPADFKRAIDALKIHVRRFKLVGSASKKAVRLD
jgi:hypothetical protein